MQQTELVDLGDIKVSNKKTTVFTIQNVGTGVALILHDTLNHVGGVAHIVLPDSSLSNSYAEQTPGKYADLAVPHLLSLFAEAGGQKRSTVVRMVGGAQLFNFGGGSGNILNVGARNATAIRTAMSKQGLIIEKADTGGNKSKSVRFVLATGQVYVQQVGGGESLL